MTDGDIGMDQIRKLKKFGLTMAGAFAVLAILFYIKDKPLWLFSAGLSGFFLFTALVTPSILQPLEKYWMKLAVIMGFIVTNILLTLVFFIAVVPTGLIMRLLGKDPLRMRSRKNTGSYWLVVDDDGPCSRFDKPY